MKRCSGCNGKKDVIGLGMMSSKCPTCNGVGYQLDSEKKKSSEKKELRSNKSNRK